MKHILKNLLLYAILTYNYKLPFNHILGTKKIFHKRDHMVHP